MTNHDAINEEPNDSQGIGERVRDHLPVGLVTLERRARAQWVALPAQVRSAIDDVVARVRKTLDLPSRSEVNDLVVRIEELDRRLAELQASRAAAAKGATRAKAAAQQSAAEGDQTAKKTAKKPRKKSGVANKTARREAIKQAATRKRK